MKKLLLLLVFTASCLAQSAYGPLSAATTNCSAVNSCVALGLQTNTGSAAITLYGAFVETLQFEASADNKGHWVAINGQPMPSGTVASSATGGGSWTFNVAAFTDIRVRPSAYTSGIAQVFIQPGTSPGGGSLGTTAITQSVFGSVLNSSTAQISAGGTFTGSCENTLSSNSLQINVITDQQITVEVDQSPLSDCSVVTSTPTYVIPASNKASPYVNFTTEATNSFYQLKLTNNGGAPTTTFRVDTAICPICNSGFANGFQVVANASNPSLAEGSANPLSSDLAGNLRVTFPPTSAAAAGIAPAPSGALETNHVFKASPGNMYSICATIGATSGWLMIIDATSAPVDGAVTPKLWAFIPTISATANTGCISYNGQPPGTFATGITAVFSTTGPFTKTASNAAFSGSVK